mgnify:CR=1 FL=1
MLRNRRKVQAQIIVLVYRQTYRNRKRCPISKHWILEYNAKRMRCVYTIAFHYDVDKIINESTNSLSCISSILKWKIDGNSIWFLISFSIESSGYVMLKFPESFYVDLNFRYVSKNVCVLIWIISRSVWIEQCKIGI